MKSRINPFLALLLLTTIVHIGTSLSASADSLMFDFGNPTANTQVLETSTAASPGPVASGTYLTLSPGHATGDVPSGETTWNTITTSDPNSSLSYSDGTSATGVTLTLGQETSAGSDTIDYSMPITSLALIGNGGGSPGRTSLLIPGSIYGNSRLDSSAVGRDGFFGGTGSAIGFRVDGLAGGFYKIYLMGRNTNSNTASLAGMTFRATTGTSSGTFTSFTSAPSAFQANTTYSTATYANQYESFAAGQNYVALTISIAEGESLFVAADGTQTETRGFLNMVQITPATESPFETWIGTFFPGETNPAIVGKDADPDGDGTNNLAEFALNGSPNNGASNGYHIIATEDTDADTQKELTLTIAVRKAGGSPVFAGSPLSATSDGVKYTIEGSLDLVFPTSAASEASPATGPGGLPADYEYRRFRLDASAGLAAKGFLRVKTEAAP